MIRIKNVSGAELDITEVGAILSINEIRTLDMEFDDIQGYITSGSITLVNTDNTELSQQESQDFVDNAVLPDYEEAPSALVLNSVSVVADDTARLALTVQEGDEAIQLYDGSHWIYDGSSWRERPVGITPIYGQHFKAAADASVQTTTEDDEWVDRDILTTDDLTLGDYMVELSYGWNHNATNTNFLAQLLHNGATFTEVHWQEAKDSQGSFASTGSSKRMYIHRRMFLSQISGVHTFELQFMSEDDDNESSIWESLITIHRVA